MMKYKVIERLSPSSINLFLKDYKKWYENYILGIPIENNIYFEFGTAFHGFLEDFFKEKQDGLTISNYTNIQYPILMNKWFYNNQTLKPFLTVEHNLKDMEQWVFKYVNQWVEETKVLENKYGSDRAFAYNTPDLCEWHLEDKELKIHGYVDAYYGKDQFNKMSGFLDFHCIIDYKTSKLGRNTNNTSYALQCYLYALMYKRMNKCRTIDFVAVDYLKHNVKHYYMMDNHIYESIEKFIKDLWIIIDEINTNPEKYAVKPPKKILLQDYLR